ncbi:hypothetical protein [Pseudomonas moorei]|uniref:hypothetical protein n=1 Tax=Pseudomonas moorei TaxID=395599 RepID=UPI00200C0A98|nr:hypothetical protein [Pseudomonas moorei]
MQGLVFLEGCGGQGKAALVCKKIKMYIFGRVTVQNEISAFLELESHLLCTDASKIDLDDQFKKISYQAFQRLEIDEANEFAHHLLASLPNLLAVVEVSREVDVYQRVAGFYLHLAMGALLSKEEYRSQIGVIERIARFREEKLPLYGRFCRTGRLFMSFANKAKVGKEAYSYLQAHFNLLVETSVREQPENIPELLGNIRSVIQFKGNYNQSAWDIPERVPELWGCPCLPELSRYVTETYAGRLSPEELNEKIESQYMPEMRAFIGSRISDLAVLNEKIETIDMALEECWKGIALNRFSSEIEIVTLRALASLLSNHPEIFIECRELRNPAGSRSFNVGHSPVPTSLGECVTEFVSAKNYSDFYAVRNDLQEYQIVDAIGALIVYELWNMFVLRAVGATIKPEIHKPVIQSCQIGELQDAEQRVDLLEVSVMKALANSRFVDRLGVLPDQLLSLKKYASQFCEFLRDAIKEKKDVQVACQKLDPEAVERFKKEVTDAIGVSIAGYEIFKRFVVGKVKPIVFNVSLPREAFLSSTNTYYMFDAYGANLAREIHNWLNAQVLFGNPKTESAEVTLPVHKGERLICSGQALKKFLSAGFKISGGDLLWPDEKGTMKFIEVNCTGDGYYLVFPGENLLVVNPAYRENGLPLSMSYTDDGGDVSFKIECYVGVQH